MHSKVFKKHICTYRYTNVFSICCASHFLLSCFSKPTRFASVLHTMCVSAQEFSASCFVSVNSICGLPYHPNTHTHAAPKQDDGMHAGGRKNAAVAAAEVKRINSAGEKTSNFPKGSPPFILEPRQRPWLWHPHCPGSLITFNILYSI